MIVPTISRIIEMHELGFSHQDIANCMGWKKDSVKSAINRLKKARATDKQASLLKKFKCNPDVSKYEANVLITNLLKWGKSNKNKDN